MSEEPKYLTCLCDHCSQRLEFPAEGVGTKIQCPTCGQTTRLYWIQSKPSIPVPPPIPPPARLARPTPSGGKSEAAKFEAASSPADSKRIGDLLWASPVRKVASLGTVAFLIIVVVLIERQKHQSELKAAIQRAAEIEAAKPREIRGQIFIVKQSGEPFRLSAVEIQVFAAAPNIEEQIANKYNEARTNLTVLWEQESKLRPSLQYARYTYEMTAKLVAGGRQLIATIDEEIALEKESVAEMESSGFGYGQDRRDLAWSLGQKKKYQGELDTNVARLATAETDLREKEGAESTLAADIRRWATPHIYFESPLGNFVTTANTDADGRFTLELPKTGSFIIVAQSSRSIGSLVEEYGWIVRIPPEKQNEILLNNNNLLRIPRKSEPDTPP